jgi:triphosphoribosyl-dephospho-CoA synthetase
MLLVLQTASSIKSDKHWQEIRVKCLQLLRKLLMDHRAGGGEGAAQGIIPSSTGAAKAVGKE